MGHLLSFPCYSIPGWSAMDMIKLTQSVNRALRAAQELHELADELPVRVRAKVMRTIPEAHSPEYQPWGGLFSHPKFKE